MVELNTNMQVDKGLVASEKQAPEQQALAMAQAGLTANTRLDSATKSVISTIIASYSDFGVNVSKYSDLSYECLSRINQNQHETIMTMLEDWAVFLQQQAKLDKEASMKAGEAAKEIERYITSQQQVIITNRSGNLVKDKRVIKRMSPRQKRMLKLANNYQAIVARLAAPTTVSAAVPAERIVNNGIDRAPLTAAVMNPNRLSLTPPQDNIGVATLITGTKVD